MQDLSHLVIGDPPQQFDPNYYTQKPPEEIDQVKTASAAGNLSRVKEVFESQWITKLPSERIKLENFIDSLGVAQENNFLDVATYLVSRGILTTIHNFIYAVQRKPYAFLQLFLDHAFNINEQINAATPPCLMLALDDEELNKWFLAYGADPNAECGLDLTPLSVAVQQAPFRIVKLLFEDGGSIKHGQLLHYAVRRDLPDQLEVLEYILDKEPQINHVMYQNRLDCYYHQRAFGIGTPLHEAAGRGNLDVVRLLLAKGADPRIKDARGKLAIERAQRHGHSEVVEYLRPLSIPSATPRHDFTDGRRVGEN